MNSCVCTWYAISWQFIIIFLHFHFPFYNDGVNYEQKWCETQQSTHMYTSSCVTDAYHIFQFYKILLNAEAAKKRKHWFSYTVFLVFGIVLLCSNKFIKLKNSVWLVRPHIKVLLVSLNLWQYSLHFWWPWRSSAFHKVWIRSQAVDPFKTNL